MADSLLFFPLVVNLRCGNHDLTEYIMQRESIMSTQKTVSCTRSVALIAMLIALLPSSRFVNYAEAAFKGKKIERSEEGLNIGVQMDTGKSRSSGDAEDEPIVALTIDTLRGLEGIWVVVTKRDIKAEKYGLIAQTIKGQVESRLQQNNIPILSKEQYKQSDKGGILCIDILPLIAEEMGYSAVGINIALMQNVLLTGEGANRVCQATTWEQRTVALCDMDGLREIPQSVIGFIDRFIKDFGAANTEHEPQEPPIAPYSAPPSKSDSHQIAGPPRSLMV